MKIFKESLTTLVLAALLCSTFPTPNALASGGGSHGGDTLVFEFSGSAQNLAGVLKTVPTIAGCPRAEILENLVNSPTTHYSSATVVAVKDGSQDVDVDARNWRDTDGNHIEISRTRVTQIRSPEIFMILVLHEFLGLMGVEGTNDRRFSQQCMEGLKALGRPELKPEALVFHIDPVSSVERAFTESRLFFQCHSEDAKSFRIRLQKKSFCTEGTGALALEYQSPTGEWTTAGRSGCLSQDQLAKLFFVQYSISSGEGRFTLAAPDMRQVKALSLSSADRATWNVNAYWMSASGNLQVSGSCTPELMVQEIR